jgi:transposase-like protein
MVLLTHTWWRDPGVNKMAFSGSLACPFCNDRYGVDYDVKKQSWKYVKHDSPYRIRYRCTHCKKEILYDISK